MKGLLERLRYPLGPSKAFLEIGHISCDSQLKPNQRGETVVDKNEKHLKSIDNTLKDILKELKKQGRPKEPNTTNSSVRHSTECQEIRYVDGLEKVRGLETDKNGWFASVIDCDCKIPITPEEAGRLLELLRTGTLATLNPEGVLKKSTWQNERDVDVKSECCKENPDAIKWNPYNEVVQCHRCGRIYLPKVYGELSERK